MYTYWKNRIREHITVIEQLAAQEEILREVKACSDMIITTFQAGGRVLICGNGGSAADAQHLATELVSKFFKERRALDAEALTVNTSSLTAIGNDYSFDRIFARQVEAKGRPGDVLIGISTSGASRNVVEAIKVAKLKGMKTVALAGGNRESELYRIVDCCIGVPSSSTPRIQEAHILIGHMVCEFVETKMCGGGSFPSGVTR